MEKRKIRSSGKMIFPQTNFFSYFLILKNDTENHFVTQVSFLIPFFSQPLGINILKNAMMSTFLASSTGI